MNPLVRKFKEWRRKNRVRRITNPGDALDLYLRWFFIVLIVVCAFLLVWFSIRAP